MTREDLLQMAREAGLLDSRDDWSSVPDEYRECIVYFAKAIEQRKCAELADKIAQMPFGDTAASFAVWVREQA